MQFYINYLNNSLVKSKIRLGMKLNLKKRKKFDFIKAIKSDIAKCVLKFYFLEKMAELVILFYKKF